MQPSCPSSRTCSKRKPGPTFLDTVFFRSRELTPSSVMRGLPGEREKKKKKKKRRRRRKRKKKRKKKQIKREEEVKYSCEFARFFKMQFLSIGSLLLLRLCFI